MTALRIRRDGNNVQIIRNGVLLLDMPWDSALEVAQAITHWARLVEQETVKREQVVQDQALLNRLGVQLGLTDNKDMQHEAMQEAYYNRFLRRYLPGGVKSEEAVGTPTLRLVK